MSFTKITAAGIGSTETVTIDGLSVINDGSFGGNVSVGGTLTYEDVTNIDSVGLITARAGIVVGSGITLSKDGDGFFTGVVTATSYAGDGSALTGISVDSTQIVTGNTSVQTVDTGSDGHVKVNTEGSERVRIIADGKVGVNKTAPNFHLDVAGNVGLTEGQVITWHDGSGTKAGDMYIDSSDNFIIRNTSSVSERFRITSDGKIGIGDASPDALLSIKGDSNGASNPSIRLKDGTDTREAWITNSAGDLILNNGGDDNTPHCKITLMDADIIHFSTANTERVRIDSSGRLLIGVTASYANASIDELQIGNNNSSNQSGLTIGSTDECAIAFADDGDARAGSITYNHGDDAMIFKTVGQNERLRITNTGQVYINTSATDTMFGIKNTGSLEFITCRNTSNTLKYYVHHSGNNYNTNGNYSQISDQSLKENIVDAKSQWNDIKNIKIRNFNFTEASGYDTHTQIGCVAQEVETVSPKLVTTPREDGIKTVSNSVLYMKGMKALQEAMTRIETLEAEVAALKSQLNN